MAKKRNKAEAQSLSEQNLSEQKSPEQKISAETVVKSVPKKRKPKNKVAKKESLKTQDDARLCELVDRLIHYALSQELMGAEDVDYARNTLLSHFQLKVYTGSPYTSLTKKPPTLDPVTGLAELLNALCDEAHARGLIEPNTTLQRDLFDTKLMASLMPRPSEVVKHFAWLYKTKGPKAATEDFYALSQKSNYIRRDRIAKDVRWVYAGRYGHLDITINCSKPEKDPRDIAQQAQTSSVSYPKCPLCKEAVGYEGSPSYPARQTHRIIPLELKQQTYYLQYSPYVYYNEHCIVFNEVHQPMKIDRGTFEALLDFVDIFPHYFIGSNADLPIVGGSILSHDHFQGGQYVFAMEKAKAARSFKHPNFSAVEIEELHWPMTVLRLSSTERSALIQLADLILKTWRSYSDERMQIVAEDESGPHNTITPIARHKKNRYELDLVLRNNRCDAKHPMGIFHPHEEKHHIKKENIGLIEVMGLAVLPGRMVQAMDLLEDAYVKGLPLTDPLIEKHVDWFKQWIARVQAKRQGVQDFDASEIDVYYQATPKLKRSQLHSLLRREIGSVFEAVLEDCAVFPKSKGSQALDRFIEAIGAKVKNKRAAK